MLEFHVEELERAKLKARRLAEKKLAAGKNADEFVEIAQVDGFKLYVSAGKTLEHGEISFHSNPRDCFHLLLEGELEITFENLKKETVTKGQYFLLSKGIKHKAVFKQLTIAIVGVYEKGLEPCMSTA